MYIAGAPAEHTAGAPTPDLELVLPALNEEARLPFALAALTEQLASLPITSSVLVVDNGSVDRTATVTGSNGVPVRVLGCAERGKGAAVRRGLLATTARWVGFCDADMATAPECLETVVAALAAGSPAVIGSRGHPASRVEARASRARHLGAWTFRRLAATVVPEISETQCGFKFFDGVLARTIAAELVATGFAFDVELLARARRRVELLEIPVEWTDVEGSTFSPLRDGARAFRELSQIRRRVRALPALAPVAPSGSSVQIPAPRQPRIDLTAVDATPVR